MARNEATPLVDPRATLRAVPAPRVSDAELRASTQPPQESDRGVSRGLSARPDWVVGAAAFVIYVVIGAVGYYRFQASGFDLGIFEQAVRHYADLSAPTAELKGEGFNLLGDHFSPVLILMAPIYKIMPGPMTLIALQAALIAWSVAVVCRAAIRQLRSTASGVALGLAYALSWGVIAAVAFDVHEIAFASPLLAMAADMLMRRRWASAFWWSVPLVLVKEDLGLTVATVGLALVLYRQCGRGLILAAVGLAATSVTVLWVIPSLSIYGRYTYMDPGSPGRAAVSVMLTQPQRWVFLLAALGIVAFLPLWSRISVIMLPTVLWRAASENPGYWGTDQHYSAVLMPILFMAAIDVLGRFGTARFARFRPRSVRSCLVAGVAAIGAAIFLASPALARTLDADSCGRCAHMESALRTIPDGARVAASNRLAAHLTSRATVFLLSPSLSDSAGKPYDVDWIVIDTADPFPAPGPWPNAMARRLTAQGWNTRYDAGGVVALSRPAAG